MVVQKAEFSKSGRNASVVKMKLRNLLSGGGTETVYRADEKFDVIQLERKEVTYSYFSDPMYVFMDQEFNQYDVEKENMESALPYLEDGLACELTFYEGKAISVELPTSVVREVTYTEPAVKGDTSGKVTKPAKLASGFEVPVPLFVNTGDKIESTRAPANTAAASEASARRGADCPGRQGRANAARARSAGARATQPWTWSFTSPIACMNA
jgi:elongation factor P